VELEREQWAIFASWSERYEAGTAGLETHPGHGGIDARYDELTSLLAPYREAPDDVRRLVGELRFDAGAASWSRVSTTGSVGARAAEAVVDNHLISSVGMGILAAPTGTTALIWGKRRRTHPSVFS
jgi:hypothetical protein